MNSKRYFFYSLASAISTAVSNAFAAFTFTSGSTPTPTQSAFPKGLIDFYLRNGHAKVIVNVMENNCMSATSGSLSDQGGSTRN